ncbi:hypothetical protein [Sulfurovum sp.]|uniref:hypothetical protein n=1 Tax=Sulfurovum sp. TaxID=1969726 RepID=UPI003564EC3D
MSLSEKTIEICKATVPVLTEQGEAITARMYEVLFSSYPETKALFFGGGKHLKISIRN